jgi:hypothetical protein
MLPETRSVAPEELRRPLCIYDHPSAESAAHW